MNSIEIDGIAYDVVLVASLGGVPAVVFTELRRVLVIDTGDAGTNRLIATAALERAIGGPPRGSRHRDPKPTSAVEPWGRYEQRSLYTRYVG